tara:strand:+ start:82 stop:243 length:162 start_codon:yes stop_codon:yes gene_type:complete
MEDKAKWEVYKVDEKGHSWKWVARDNSNNELHLFPTKKKAMEFVAQYIQEGAK